MIRKKLMASQWHHKNGVKIRVERCKIRNNNKRSLNAIKLKVTQNQAQIKTNKRFKKFIAIFCLSRPGKTDGFNVIEILKSQNQFPL